MEKGDRERAALQVVYDEEDFDTVTQRESPDFVLSRRDGDAFGVEITELFDTESDARIMNLPSYISEILAGKPHKHKDDVKTLSVSEVTITDKDGNEKASGVPAIIRELPSIETRAQFLVHAISKKQKKAPDYLDGLTHVNLIIMDRSDGSWRPESLNIGELLIPDLRSALLESRFREIFFVTRTRARGRFFVPLRMVLLVSELYFFAEAVSTYERAIIDKDQLIDLFTRYMQSPGYPIQFVSVQGRPAACLGNSAVGLGTESTEIFDFADFPAPKDLPLAEDFPRFILEDDFVSHHARTLEAGTFVTEIAMDPVIDPPL